MYNKVTGPKSPLTAAGSFIKDHGIAIFLVVFFVVFIYPEQAKERKEWIVQITELQDSLDPSKRPIATPQAEIILDLVTDVFIQTIESTMQTELIPQRMEYSGPRLTLPYRSTTEVELRIFDTKFLINTDKDVEAQAEKEFNKYTRAVKKHEIALRQVALIALDKSTRSARHATAGLRNFIFSNGTLSDIWESAFSSTYSQFSQSLIESYAHSSTYEYNRERFVKFLEDAGAELPSSLLEVNSHKTPSLVIFEFRKHIRKEWKGLLSR